MDGILVDLLGKWLATHNFERHDAVIVSDLETWGQAEELLPGFGDIIKRPGFFDDLEPLAGAVEGFLALKAYGHEVAVCTAAASEDSARAKLEWCKRYLGISRRDVFVTHKKTWLAGTCDVLIDDKPKTLAEWAETGKMAVTIAYPYNLEVANLCELRADSYADTASAWSQIVERLC